MNDEEDTDGLDSMQRLYSATLVTNLKAFKECGDLHVRTSSNPEQPVLDPADEGTTTSATNVMNQGHQLMQTLDQLAEECRTYAEKYENVVKGLPAE